MPEKSMKNFFLLKFYLAKENKFLRRSKLKKIVFVDIIRKIRI